MRDYTKIKAFMLVDELVIFVYHVTKKFPVEEKFGLVQQIRRAIISVSSNIVEGCFRQSKKEFIRFLEIAYASLKEAHYQLNISMRLGYLDSKTYELIDKKMTEAEKVLVAYYKFQKNDLK